MLTLAKEDFRWKVFTLASLTTTTDDFSDFYRLVDTRNYNLQLVMKGGITGVGFYFAQISQNLELLQTSPHDDDYE